MSSNWYRPPPAPLDLPEPAYPEPPRSFPQYPAADLFPLQLPVHQHSPTSPAASLPDSPAPPLRGLATKFAQMMGRGTSPVPPSSSSGAGDGGWGAGGELKPPAPVARPGHGHSKSLGQPVSPYWEQQSEDVLNGDEIERLAREEREWSRREAERLMALENQRLAGGALGMRVATSPVVERDEQTPKKLASRANSYFDASSTPPTATRSSTAPVPSTTPASSASRPAPPAPLIDSSLPALPAQKSPYLLPHAADPDALDVPASLVLLARKFEKLELYSVTHLRALSSRMGDLEGRVKELEGREGVVQVRKEMRQLKGAMADGFRALEGEIEGLGRRGRDGFGLGVGTVEQHPRQEPQSMPEEPESMPCLSSSASSTSSHHHALQTPSPGLAAGAFPVDTTPLAVNKTTPSSANANLEASAQASSARKIQSPSTSPVPPRKRYTALLSSRSLSSESTPQSVTSSPAEASSALIPPSVPQVQSQSTPLPSAPFPPTRSQTASHLPSPTQPLLVKNRSPSALDVGHDSPTRRRARSVGSSLSAQGEDEGSHKKVLGEDVKASNRGRAPVGKLISAWERK